MDKEKLRMAICRAAKPFAICYSMEIDELVNIVWLMGNIQKLHPKLWLSRARYDILDWLRSAEMYGRPEAKTYEKRYQVKNPFGLYFGEENLERKELGRLDKSINAVDTKEWLNYVTRYWSRQDKLILVLMIEGMDQVTISKTIGVSPSRICQLEKMIIERLKNDSRVSDI